MGHLPRWKEERHKSGITERLQKRGIDYEKKPDDLLRLDVTWNHAHNPCSSICGDFFPRDDRKHGDPLCVWLMYPFRGYVSIGEKRKKKEERITV